MVCDTYPAVPCSAASCLHICCGSVLVACKSANYVAIQRYNGHSNCLQVRKELLSLRCCPVNSQLLSPTSPFCICRCIDRIGSCLAGGKALLLLVPSEQEAMLAKLKASNIPIKQSKVNPNKTQSITGALQALLSKHPELKVGHAAVCPLCRATYSSYQESWLTVYRCTSSRWEGMSGLDNALLPEWKLVALKRHGLHA